MGYKNPDYHTKREKIMNLEDSNQAIDDLNEILDNGGLVLTNGRYSTIYELYKRDNIKRNVEISALVVFALEMKKFYDNRHKKCLEGETMMNDMVMRERCKKIVLKINEIALAQWDKYDEHDLDTLVAFVKTEQALIFRKVKNKCDQVFASLDEVWYERDVAEWCEQRARELEGT